MPVLAGRLVWKSKQIRTFLKLVFGEDSWITTFHCCSMRPPKRCFAKYFDWPLLYYFVFFYLQVQKMFFPLVFSTFFSQTRNCFAAGHPMLTLKPHQREYHCLLKFRIDCKWRIPCLANSVELNALVEYYPTRMETISISRDCYFE